LRQGLGTLNRPGHDLYESGGELYISDRLRGWLRVEGGLLQDAGAKNLIVRYAGTPHGQNRTVITRDKVLKFDGTRMSPAAADKVSLDVGPSRVEYPSPLSRFDQGAGLPGSVAAILRHDGVLYAATNSGVFRLAPGRPARFEPVNGTAAGVAALVSTRAGLLAGGYGGVYVIRGGRASSVLHADDVHLLRLSATDPDEMLVTTDKEMRRLRFSRGKWTPADAIPIRMQFRLCNDGRCLLPVLMGGHCAGRISGSDGIRPKLDSSCIVGCGQDNV